VRTDISEYFSNISVVEDTHEQDAFKHYTAIGGSLSDHEIIMKLRQELRVLRDKAIPHHFFYLVDGPSGIGKTQLPFALSAGVDGVKICHLLMTRGETSSNQKIYNCFSKKSTIFQNCLMKDLQRIQKDGLGSEILEVFDLHLWTVAFVFAVFGKEINPCTDCRVPALRGLVENMKPEDRSIFFLDEVLTHLHTGGTITSQSDEARSLQLARNVLRSVGLVVVLMGTNSCAANFVALSQNSRGYAGVWCKLITELPRSTEKSLRSLGALDLLALLRRKVEFRPLVEFLRNQFVSCLPWFVENFVTSIQTILNPLELSAVDLLDLLFHHIATIVYRDKYRIRTSGLRPQFCMHLDGHRRLNLDHQPPAARGTGTGVLGRSQTSSFVANHFAVLDHGNIDLKIGPRGLMMGETDWFPFSSFVSAKWDPLLYLTLGGGKRNFPLPFVDWPSNSRMSTHQALILILKHHKISSGNTEVSLVNNGARKRDGDILEALSSVAMELASHRNGLAGINIVDFLLTLAEELLPTHRDLSWDPDPNHQLSYFLSPSCLQLIVPYLSPANDAWPDLLHSIDGCRVASMNRPPDRDELDLEIPGWGITGECKNYQDALPLGKLCTILGKIPEASRVHLVFVSKIQGKYFTEKDSWPTFYASQTLGSICILKAFVHGEFLRMEPLFDGSTSICRAERVVIVFHMEGIHEDRETDLREAKIVGTGKGKNHKKNKKKNQRKSEKKNEN
jgi:hypothetical protein